MNIICTHCGGHKYGFAGPKCTCPDPKTERIKELESQLSEAREALKNLVNKLEKLEADKQYQSVWTLYAIHGGKYSGPSYKEEFNLAKEALAKLDSPK